VGVEVVRVLRVVARVSFFSEARSRFQGPLRFMPALEVLVLAEATVSQVTRLFLMI
jgi:hypothetical protein